MIQLLYPEKRRVSEDKIFMWHDDAVANGKLPKRTRHLDEAISDLEDIGFITVARKGAVGLLEA